MRAQALVDSENADFWNMICGSSLAKHLGIAVLDRANLKRFEASFNAIYPYLPKYIGPGTIKDGKLLEIGLGFGTVGQILHDSGADYYGLDIAPAPVELMKYR